MTVRSATPQDVRALAGLLVDAVDGGASVGPLAGLRLEQAVQFWTAHLADALVLVAVDPDGIVGTAGLVLARPANGQHRAEVSKVLVAPRARRQGVATRLLSRLEELAREHHRWLLVLDTTTGSAAEQLYTAHGWQTSGVVPDYAALPDGTPAPTTVMWKRLALAARLPLAAVTHGRLATARRRASTSRRHPGSPPSTG